MQNSWVSISNNADCARLNRYPVPGWESPGKTQRTVSEDIGGYLGKINYGRYAVDL